MTSCSSSLPTPAEANRNGGGPPPPNPLVGEQRAQRKVQMMAEAAVTRYWCHECEQAIEEAIVEEIKCPFCDGGFIEEMIGQEFEGFTSRQSERGLSGGILNNPFEQPEVTRDGDDEYDDEDDDLGHEFEGFIRRHRRASALRRVLDSIQDDLRADRERDSSNLINAFNQALTLQGSVLDPDEAQGDQGGSNNDDGLLEEYVLGTGLSLLLQHLAENDPNRYGTPPAKKEVVEALPTVQIEEAVSCSVCLDELDLGSQAKQMPCKHKFHSPCIIPWLELHSSCPVCRFELPSEGTKDLNEPSNIDSMEGSHEEVGAVSLGNGSESSNRAWTLVPWFNGLFSTPEPQAARGAFAEQQPPSATEANPNAGES